jgi:hypothetical protein
VNFITGMSSSAIVRASFSTREDRPLSTSHHGANLLQRRSGAVITVFSGRVLNGSLVLEDEVPLPDGTPVTVSIEVVVGNGEARTPESTTDFAAEPFFGMWADREDMADSTAWVRRQRDEWQQRLTRSD